MALRVSLDGGETWKDVDSTIGVRLYYDNLSIPGEDVRGEIYSRCNF